MKLNKISNALRMVKISQNQKAALFTTVLSTMVASSAYAEEATQQAVEVTQAKTASTIEVKNEQGDIEVIEVSGMRGTMTRSLNEKKNNSAIVDAIAAADFGDLPGLSLSDIIENISGASGHRLKGSQNEISIRGLGSYWGYATFNGRTITNAGPGRAVNFKKFPSELVDKITIYKSQQASLVEGGTSGTIEVGSLRAVDYGRNKTTIEAKGIYNDYYLNVDGENTNPWGGQVTFSTVQNFETDNMGDIGFTLGFTHTDSSNPEENYGGSSQMGICALRDASGNDLEGGSDCVTNEQGVSAGRVGRSPTPDAESIAGFDESSMFYVPYDAYWRTGEDQDTRTGIVGTLQWVPNDQWNINLDYEFSDLEYTEKRMEFGIDNRRRALEDHIIADDHTLLYVTGEARPQLSGENRNQVDEYRGGGLNIEFQATDDLMLKLDASYSESYRYRLRQRSKLRSNDYHNYAFDARGTNVPSITWLNDDRTGPSDFDPNDITSFLDEDGVAYAEYRRNNEERNDRISAIAFSGEYQLDNEFFSSIEAGVRYSHEHLKDEQTTDVSLSLTDGSQVYGASDNYDNDWDEDFAANNVALIEGITTECLNNHQNGNLFNEEGGGSGQFATYDSECFIGQMLGQIPANNGDTSFYDIGERDDKRDGADRDVTEEITAAYVMANIDAEIGGMQVFGNVGVRVVKTETHSEGWGDKVYITSNEDGTYTTDINATGEIEAVTLDSEYTEYLPSLNLTWAVRDDFYVRTSAYQAMSRFQMNAMSSGVSYETCQDENDDICDPDTNTDYTSVITGGEASGNHMKPYLSNNYDLSLEYYPSLDAAVTLAFYYKDFNGGYENVEENRDVLVSLDGVDAIYPDVSVVTKQTSDESSVIKGFEFTAQKHFVELPEPFNGLGAKIAYNYADSSFITPEIASPGIIADANLFGFSDSVASGSIYWEGEQLSFRILYKLRTKYFQPNNLPFPDRSHRYVQDSDYLDFSAKYKIDDTFSVSFQAINLLDEPQVQTRGNDTTISDYSRSGSKFLVGVKAQF